MIMFSFQNQVEAGIGTVVVEVIGTAVAATDMEGEAVMVHGGELKYLVHVCSICSVSNSDGFRFVTRIQRCRSNTPDVELSARRRLSCSSFRIILICVCYQCFANLYFFMFEFH